MMNGLNTSREKPICYPKIACNIFIALFFIGLACYSEASGQQRIDSLINALPYAESSKRARLLAELSSLLVNFDPQQAIRYAEQGLQLVSPEMDTLKADFLYFASVGYGRLGNFSRQLELGKESLSISMVIEDQRRQAKVMSVIAMAYFNLGSFESSLSYQLKVLKIREAAKDSTGLVGSYNNLGIVYQRLNQPEDAINSYHKALDYIGTGNSEQIRGAILNNLGSLYSRIGKNAEAIVLMNKALSLHEATGNREGLSLTHNNLGIALYALGKEADALSHYLKALKLNEEAGDKHGIAVTAMNLGSFYQKTENKSEALRYFNYSLKLSNEEGFRDIEMNSYLNLAIFYETIGNYRNAYEYHTRYTNLKDSLFTEETSGNMNKMRALYEADRKEQDNILLNQKLAFKQLQLNRRLTIIYFASALLAGLLLLSFSLFRSYLHKKRALSKELEFSRLISRFVSTVTHEFRTPLAGISSSVQLLEDYGNDFGKTEQKKLFTRINDSLSGLKSMLDELTILEKEKTMRTIVRKNNFSFEAFLEELVRDILVSSQNSKDVVISVNSQPLVGEITTDRELLRHVISNVLSNAVKYSGSNGKVRIEKSITDNLLQISVSDEGIGIPADDIPLIFNDFYRSDNAESIPGTGLGMSIVKNALDHLGGKIHIDSLLNTGTSVMLTIPVIAEYIIPSENEKSLVDRG